MGIRDRLLEARRRLLNGGQEVQKKSSTLGEMPVVVDPALPDNLTGVVAHHADGRVEVVHVWDGTVPGHGGAGGSGMNSNWNGGGGGGMVVDGYYTQWGDMRMRDNGRTADGHSASLEVPVVQQPARRVGRSPDFWRGIVDAYINRVASRSPTDGDRD